MIISIYPFDKQLQEHLGILVQCDASGLSIKIDNSLSFLWKITAVVWSLLIAKFRLKLKKVGKTTRPFRYDLNQIPYNYTVEVRNRFKGLDLIDRVPDELWNEVRDIVQETGIKTIPKKEMQKKQNSCLRRPYKQLWKEEKWKAKEKRKDISIWMQSSKE